MGAVGIAILAKNNKLNEGYNLDINNISFETKGSECTLCPNNCEVLKFYKESELIDTWGNRCPKGSN